MPLYHTSSKKNRRKRRFNSRSAPSKNISSFSPSSFHSSKLSESEVLRPVYDYDGYGNEVLLGYISIPISDWARCLRI